MTFAQDTNHIFQPLYIRLRLLQDTNHILEPRCAPINHTIAQQNPSRSIRARRHEPYFPAALCTAQPRNRASRFAVGRAGAEKLTKSRRQGLRKRRRRCLMSFLRRVAVASAPAAGCHSELRAAPRFRISDSPGKDELGDGADNRQLAPPLSPPAGAERDFQNVLITRSPAARLPSTLLLALLFRPTDDPTKP
ncbi:hypothetical protein KM043_010092 [Ampulex compressa]|nr:hypothetical protein KM043_010092 [Ampulex compressa]